MILYSDQVSIKFEYEDATINDYYDVFSKAVEYFEEKHGAVDYEDVVVDREQEGLRFYFDVEA